MTNKRKGKLELDWVDKGDIILTKFDEKGKTYPASYFQGQVSDEELMPRELELVESVGDPKSENMLIWGENLIALRSLEKEFTGRIKLIYIDPPFNTGQDFEDYEDGLEHSIWLNMIENRLRIAKKLLRKDGIIFSHIDDTECHRCRCLMDEIFLPSNFISQIAYQRSGAAGLGQGSKLLVNTTEFIIVYANDKTAFNPELIKGNVTFELKDMKRYKNVLIEEGKRKKVFEFRAKSNNEPVTIYKHSNYKIRTISLANFNMRRDDIIKDYINNFEQIYRGNLPQKENSFQHELISIMDGGLYSVDYIPSRGAYKDKKITNYYYKRELFAWLKNAATLEKNIIYKSNKLTDFWTHEEIPKADLANEGGVTLLRGKKPEQLLKRILQLCTDNGDYVLDFFAGSGTTSAVAHKMGRKWIMVEIRKDMVKEKAFKRMKNVVNGDPRGISEEVGWKGGGGFKFYKLGEPLIVKHKDYSSIKIINPKYYNTALIKVICNLEGFKFRKGDKLFHGINKLGNKYAHITEQYVSKSYIDFLKSKIADNEEMIIYCFNYDEKINLPFNMIIKKLPTDLGKAYQLRLGL